MQDGPTHRNPMQDGLTHRNPPRLGTDEIIEIRQRTVEHVQHNTPDFFGVSEKTTGSQGLSMNLVEVPPSGRAEARTHSNSETALYVLGGRVEIFYGAGLRKSICSENGCFLYIPPNVPYQMVNLSQTQSVQVLAARNDSNV